MLNRRLAVLGGEPVFPDPVVVGQFNSPSTNKLEQAFKGIFNRRYFANHGPLVNKLDQKLADILNVKYALCVTNEITAIMVLSKALGLKGEVIVPAVCETTLVNGLLWAGLTPVLSDVNPDTMMITTEVLEGLINNNTSAIIGIHQWGQACEPESLHQLCNKHNLKLIFNAADAAGSKYQKKTIGGFGCAEFFSFDVTRIIYGGEGGCITTNDDEIAKKIKTIRSFHPGETYTTVPLRFNAKMSEAQAALALISLDELETNINNNKKNYHLYTKELAGIPGLRILPLSKENNFEQLVLTIDEKNLGVSKELFCYALKLENIHCKSTFECGYHLQHPKIIKTQTYETSKLLCKKLLLLPIGKNISKIDIQTICGCIRSILENKDIINKMKNLQI